MIVEHFTDRVLAMELAPFRNYHLAEASVLEQRRIVVADPLPVHDLSISEVEYFVTGGYKVVNCLRIFSSLDRIFHRNSDSRQP
jgi:hypothetical protein